MHKFFRTFIDCLCKFALIIFFIGSLNVYAQVENTKNATLDQNVTVTPADDEQSSRNPFQPYTLPEEELAVQEIYSTGGDNAGVPSEAPGDDPKDKFDYASLQVTGSVWGNDMPKAIINDQVMGIGDVINEAKILNITKEGILFEFKDKQYLMKRESLSVK